VECSGTTPSVIAVCHIVNVEGIVDTYCHQKDRMKLYCLKTSSTLICMASRKQKVSTRTAQALQKESALCPNRTSDLIIAYNTSDTLYH
jgi:hypothetical protein